MSCCIEYLQCESHKNRADTQKREIPDMKLQPAAVEFLLLAASALAGDKK
jgi:hypothetical protein